MPHLPRFGRSARLMVGASALTTLGAIAPFLVGSQAVLLMRDLGFGAGQLGLVVSTFFAVAALVTILGGPLIERFGDSRGHLLGGLLVAAGSFGVALLVQEVIGLVAALALLGAGNAICQGTSNRTVATLLPAHRRGLGFGLKQSAVPAAIMLGGLAVPTTTAYLGWRATFAIVGSIGLLVALTALARLLLNGGSRPEPAPRRGGKKGEKRHTGLDKAPWGPLLLCGAAITAASAAANFLGAYLASWAHEVGLTVGQAGVLMAAGSGTSILVRIASGFQADRRYGANLPVVATMMLVGGVSVALLGALPTPWAVVVLGFVAFAVGWSWPGLMLYAVARLGRDAPTSASSVVQAGAFVGGALGPLAFGLVVSLVSFQGAWWVAAVAFTLAGVLTLLARRGFRKDLERRPPMEPFGYGGGRREPRFTTGG
ncbi:MFS transporter [Ornithinimicrobium sp. Y1847]|uniref:MFS transporter n=1 Tax=Ornithinimicrobium sp. Y1847 TaxID=3405419 RepID=UPI003B6701A3